MPQADPVLVHPDIADLVPGFLAHRREHLRTMEGALRAGDLETLRRHGHDLKGCAPGYGFVRLGGFGEAIELFATEGQLDALRSALTSLSEYLDSVRWRPMGEEEVRACTDW